MMKGKCSHIVPVCVRDCHESTHLNYHLETYQDNFCVKKYFIPAKRMS